MNANPVQRTVQGSRDRPRRLYSPAHASLPLPVHHCKSHSGLQRGQADHSTPRLRRSARATLPSLQPCWSAHLPYVHSPYR